MPDVTQEAKDLAAALMNGAADDDVCDCWTCRNRALPGLRDVARWWREYPTPLLSWLYEVTCQVWFQSEEMSKRLGFAEKNVVTRAAWRVHQWSADQLMVTHWPV